MGKERSEGFGCCQSITASLPVPGPRWVHVGRAPSSPGTSGCTNRLWSPPPPASDGGGQAGIFQGRMKGMFEDLFSVCEQGLEERRSKKKIGAELKSMAGRD